jgi:hypothetical protein
MICRGGIMEVSDSQVDLDHCGGPLPVLWLLVVMVSGQWCAGGLRSWGAFSVQVEFDGRTTSLPSNRAAGQLRSPQQIEVDQNHWHPYP